MLPFLKPKKAGTVIMAKTKPQGGLEGLGEEGETDHGMLSAAEDLIRAVHAKDAQGVADALKAAMDLADDDGEKMSDGGDVNFLSPQGV